MWNGLFIRLLCSDKEGPTERIVYFGEDSTAIVASGSFTINCKDNATIHAEAGTVMYIHAGSYHFSGIGTLYCGGSR